MDDGWSDESPKKRDVVNAVAKVELVKISVGGFEIVFLVDSGSPINAITEEEWRLMRAARAKTFDVKDTCEREFRGYAAGEPLKVVAVFKAIAESKSHKPTAMAEFFVVRGASQALLGRGTARAMRLLLIGSEVLAVAEKIVRPFPSFPGVLVDLHINESVQPVQITYYRVPVAVEPQLKEILSTMKAQDIVEDVVGPAPWISPLVVATKKKEELEEVEEARERGKGEGGIRACVNMTEPNKAIMREHHPMPNPETFIPKLKGAAIFSKVDLKSAFHHVMLSERSRVLTTFMTGEGLMRYKRLTFGMNAAPEIFQRVIEGILAGLDGVIAFIDDIVVFGRSQGEHDERLAALLKRLRQNNAVLNDKKCVYGVSEIDILGFRADGKGVRPSDSKTEAIKNFRAPETKEEVRSFLGLVQFVGHFIPHLATRSEALRKMVRGEVGKVGPEQMKAFDDLRTALVNSVIKLGYFDVEDETMLYADASPVGLGAVLVQRKDGVARVIAFASKSLTPAERRYPQTQREALGLVWATERFYFYLYAKKFTLFTDHKTLEYLCHLC